MSGSPESFDEDNNVRERRTHDSERAAGVDADSWKRRAVMATVGPRSTLPISTRPPRSRRTDWARGCASPRRSRGERRAQA